MNKDEILLSKIVPHNRDYITFKYDNHFTSKLLMKRSWKDGAGQELPFADNYESCLFVWPPRNYTCNFCDREFRSAQALGGHMNVHRRDRARLQEAIHPDQDDDHDDTTIHASTHERSNSGAVSGFEKALISPTVCDISPNPFVVSVGLLKSNQKEDDLTIASAKRRHLNPLIEPQHDQEVDLELRL